MSKLLVEIDEHVLGSFPDLRTGGFLAAGLDVMNDLTPAQVSQWESARAVLIEQGLTIDNLTADPRIVAWRNAFRRSGLKPSSYRSSAEQLARRVLRGERLVTPLPIVNIYCALSAAHLAPMGGYDVERLPAMEVRLRYAHPEQDTFHPLGGRSEDMPLTPSVVVYACDTEVICWSFNHRDSRATCLEQNTRLGLFLCEAVDHAQYDSVTIALEKMRQTLANAGARVGELAFADNRSRRIELTI